MSLVGEHLPGGRNGSLFGDCGRDGAGVVGRESLSLDLDRLGGGIVPSLLKTLDLLLDREGEGDSRDNVSAVRSDKDGRGLRRSFASGSTLGNVGFSKPSSKTGVSASELGGVISKVAVCASRRASRTGDALLGLTGFSFHPNRYRSD